MAKLWRVFLVPVAMVVLSVTARPVRLSAKAVAPGVYASTPVPTAVPPTPTTSSAELRIDALEERIDDLSTLVEVQSSTFDATAARMESNQSQLLAILGVASLVVAVLGLGIVRIWIRNLVEQRLRDVATREFSRQVQAEIDKLRDEWDPKFAELYREYQRVVQRAGGRES